ncbi:MAG: GTPase Era [Candidatus Omnitrophica bacterium]|nr:GTPase Era [Candidatus Omnitrophota bacterium]
METQNKLHCGIVAIVGRPNTGKSTLLNKILGEKLVIVSKVPQTTRNAIRGIFTDQRGQIVFIDTPGMHLPRHKLGSIMLKRIDEAIESSDLIIHLVDTNDPVGQEENMIVEKIKVVKVPIILGLNKIDLKAKFIDSYIKLWEQKRGKTVDEMVDGFILMPLSGLKGTNVDRLLEVIFAHLPLGPLLYPEDVVSDFPQRLAIAEFIREKIINLMRKEVPHSVAVYIEDIQPRQTNLIYIRAIILVERESQKAIVIGKDGQILKMVGQQARPEIEALLSKQVFLETRVKVKSDWQQDPFILKELGYI